MYTATHTHTYAHSYSYTQPTVWSAISITLLFTVFTQLVVTEWRKMFFSVKSGSVAVSTPTEFFVESPYSVFEKFSLYSDGIRSAQQCNGHACFILPFILFIL